MPDEKRGIENPESRLQLPELYSGMRVEVLTKSNQLLFVGRAEVLDGDVLMITEESGEKVPWVEYNAKVKLRGFQASGESFSLYGYVSGSSEYLWKIDRLETLQAGEKRKFYRQTMGAPAMVMCVNQIFGSDAEQKAAQAVETVECRIMDISGGGVRLQSKKDVAFQVGDWLLFSTENPLEKGPNLNYTCRVQRVNELSKAYEYGCEFQGLTEEEREPLLRLVMALQQKELRTRRRRDD